MNPRQRFIETMTFGRPDRPPFLEFSLRPATLDNWRRQGLPPDVDVQAFFGFDPTISVPVTTGPLPRFEVKILHQDDRYKIWIDELGALRKDFVHDREPGFVTRTWLKFPVQSRRDFLQIKHRFDPDHPDRLPPDFARWAQQARNRTCPLRLTLHSMFWELRDWMGFHGLCTAFYDAPDLVHQMMQFQTDFNIALCSRIFQHVMPDWVFLQEDMAYKTASMISPQMVRQFMLPHYRRLASFLRDAGVPVVMLDSDGHVSELIPIWLEAGINAANPFEVAAGMDVVQVRRRWPTLGIYGGIDKRVLTGSRDQIRQELLRRVPPVIQTGGFIPTIDHAVPANVPFENYCYYLELLRQLLGVRAS